MSTHRGRSVTGLLAWAAVAMFLASSLLRAADLSDQEARGKQLYMSGAGGSQEEPAMVYIGEERLALPASVAPCSSCHGADGRGRPEGGVIPSDITWANLTKSYGHRHAYGRSHGAYDENSLATAILSGADPAGNRFGEAMPTYSMGSEDMAALIAYMKRLESDPDPGLEKSSLRVATLLPGLLEADSLGQAMSAVMNAYVDKLNQSGGIFNRRLELVTVPTADSPQQTLARLEAEIETGRIFALVNPYAVGMEDGLSAMVERHQIPAIGPFTSAPPAGRSLDRYAFYLLSGPAQRQKVLLEYATGELGIPMAALASVGDPRALPPELQALDAPPGAGQWLELARKIAASGIAGVLFSGTPGDLSALMAALAEQGSVPYLFIAPELVTAELFAAPSAFHKQVLVAYPSLPSDISDSGRELYAELAKNHALSRNHVSAQVSALAAMKIFVEGAKRAGRDLSRDKLILELEALEGYQSGLMPPVSYNLNRRVGALGAHLVALDLGARTLVPVGDWKELDK